jgi:transposase
VRTCQLHRSLSLGSQDVEHLQRLLRATSTPQALAIRAQIVLTLHTHPDWSRQRIAQSIGIPDRLVRKWRRRWEETHCLNDLPRSGAPRRFSSEVRAQVTALACSLPRSHGVPLAHWSRAELARHLATVPGLPTISASTLGRWLLAEQIRPWRFHSWQHIQDQEMFLQRARPVLQLYEQAHSLLQDGIWVVCADEKTSIQAREAEQAPCPTIPKHVLHQSPRYHRRGALHLLAALSVADGLVYGQCASRKRFIDFRTFVQMVLMAEARRRGVQTLALILPRNAQ